MLSMKKKKTKELLLLFLLFLLCGALFAIRHFTASSKNSIKITVYGREQGIYDLSCDQIIRIGETNVCEIRDGQVRMRLSILTAIWQNMAHCLPYGTLLPLQKTA